MGRGFVFDALGALGAFGLAGFGPPGGRTRSGVGASSASIVDSGLDIGPLSSFPRIPEYPGMHTRPDPVVSILVGLMAVIAVACSALASPSPSARPSPSPLPSPDPAAPVVVTFEAANGKTWKQRLTQPDDIAIAWQHARGETAPTIPNGKIVRTGPDVNVGWSWHLDPDDFEWADVTPEVCDGLPDYVEDRSLTSDRYCSWHAIVVSVEPLS